MAEWGEWIPKNVAAAVASHISQLLPKYARSRAERKKSLDQT